MNSQKYIAGIIFISLLIFGPMDYSWPLWIVIRISYLILIPILIWLLLKWLWIFWKPSKEDDDRLLRALASATSGVFFVLAIIQATAKNHIGNTLYIQTRDGLEAVGDNIIQKGADWSLAIMLFIFSIVAFSFSISKRE